MLLTATDAGQIAFEFLMADWNISEYDREWFTIVNSRLVGESWYIVELGVAGFPDRWFIQVYDTGLSVMLGKSQESRVKGQGFAYKNPVSS